MSEKATAKALMEAIPEQDPVRIESKGTGPGIPDIWCGDCAIETKCLPQYPKRILSPVVLKHKLTLPQYRWLNRRWRAGYKAFVVLQVRRVEWYLFAAPDAYVLVDGHEIPKQRLIRQALYWSREGLTQADDFMSTIGFTFNSFLKLPIARINQLREESGLVARWKNI